MDAATHLAGAVCPDRAQTAADVIDAGMNDKSRRASPISGIPPVTVPDVMESTESIAMVIAGQTAIWAKSTGSEDRNSVFHLRSSKAGAMARPMNKSENTEYA